MTKKNKFLRTEEQEILLNKGIYQYIKYKK